MLHTPKHTFALSIVLHVPHIRKPLFSVHKLYRDYNVYFEFHASVFYVKDPPPRQYSFMVKVIMVSMFCLSLLPCNPLGLLFFLRLYIC